MLKPTWHHLVIVGSGMEGLMTAVMAAESGFKDIVVYDAPDINNLGPDSLRNHGWLQSGLLYPGKSRVAARKMWPWGRAMHEKMGFPIPSAPGIFRFFGEIAEANFLDWAKELRLENSISLLNDYKAKNKLGAFYERGFVHYQVPDTLFKEADLMNKARAMAKEAGVYFRPSRVKLIPNSKANSGFLIETDQELIEAEHVILCAGRGIPELLEQLSIKHPLEVYQSCLLRVRCGDVMQTPLLVDRSEGRPTSGLSVVQHYSHALPPDGCLVIGNRERRRLESHEILDRNVTAEEDSKLRSVLPSRMGQLRRGRELSVIACAKTEAKGDDDETSVDSWVESWPEYPGLVAVVPGKATLTLYAANEALKKIKPGTDFSSTVPAGADLNERFKMHHEHDLDELDRTDNGGTRWTN